MREAGNALFVSRRILLAAGHQGCGAMGLGIQCLSPLQRKKVPRVVEEVAAITPCQAYLAFTDPSLGIHPRTASNEPRSHTTQAAYHSTLVPCPVHRYPIKVT